jgi:aspartate 1-decarboxylase
VDSYNISNGQRFHTYVIKGRKGNREVCLNGGAARMGSEGDLIIICSYSLCDQEDLLNYRPTIVYVDSGNRITEKKD